MATKIFNEHIYNIIENSNKYHTPDVYVALVHIASEIKDQDKKIRFVIQTGDN